MSFPPELEAEIARALTLIERMVALVPNLTEAQTVALLLRVTSMQTLIICLLRLPETTDFHAIARVMGKLILDVHATEDFLATIS